MEFAHNARPHSSTKITPFKAWYGFNPSFIPLVIWASKFPSVQERLQSIEEMRKEITASLKQAAEVMKRSNTLGETFRFKEGDLVWLEGTNIKTTYPKLKLAPKRHGPFEVLAALPVNCRLKLPKTWKIHPVFHNSLLKPYKETAAHGPNYPRPPPEIVDEEGEHYEVDAILQTKYTQNRKSVLYLVHWKDYPTSERTWEPLANLKGATELVNLFH